MDTGVLRGFAGVARAGLLGSVGGRMSVVLAPASDARVVSPGLVAELELEIAAAGGGDAGRAVVVDRAAYTWFNRIVALRFMDAAGVTTAGVVSPATGGVQPEILQLAKQGVFEDAVDEASRVRVAGFLSGERVSPNPDRDAYGVLLAAYCRHWNRAMPFLFEQSADYTELLVPGDLLADDSVRHNAVRTLSTEVCTDVEVIGWLYQFYISDRKDEVFAGFKKGKKAGAAEIPAATQLFTPHWIVRYLVENSLGRLWLLNHPDSDLRNVMEYYIDPVDEETDYLRITGPEEIKIIDPACGSGHMLTYAFDLLFAIYEEEGYPPSEIPGLILTHNLYGTEIDPRAGELAAFALTMKAQLRQKTFLAKGITPNILVLRNIRFAPDELDRLRHSAHDRADEDAFWNLFEHADLFGSLLTPDETILTTAPSVLEGLAAGDIITRDIHTRAIAAIKQATYLSPRYHVVIANPPYMGGKNMSAPMVGFARANFEQSKADLYAMFIERNSDLAQANGAVAMVTMQSWMFLSTFVSLRAQVLNEQSIITLAHLGTASFDSIGGEVVATTAFVLRTAPSRQAGAYLGLSALSGEKEQARTTRAISDGSDLTSRHDVRPHELVGLPLSAMAFWLAEEERHVYRDFPSISAIAATRQGLATGDNARFLRQWWEVSAVRTKRDAASANEALLSGATWFPVQKGGSPRRWAGNDDLVVNWGSNGKDLMAFRPRSVIRNPSYYFREGATWSSLSSAFGARHSPAGFLFESKGSMLFPQSDGDLRWLIGYLNTPVASVLIDSMSPTLDYHEGPVGRIPVISPADPNLVDAQVSRALNIAERLWTARETAPRFQWASPNSPMTLVSTHLKQLREAALSDEEAVKGIEREIEVHFRTSGNLSESAFPVARQRPTGLLPSELASTETAEFALTVDLSSFAVGCLFGRFSLDAPGLVLADQGDTSETFAERVSKARFVPDRDNVIPIVDGDWFEDDIVAQFREWLKVAFGPEHLQENWQYIEDTLGKSIRQYFVKNFYADHVRRYKKRPIYWLFSSPKGTFNALIYMHRYTPATVGTVLHDYVLPYLTKLETELRKQEHLAASADTPRAAAAATKRTETLRKQILEVGDWATDTLHPLADQQVVIDLDDGVKHNYPRFGQALKKIPGLDTQ